MEKLNGLTVWLTGADIDLGVELYEVDVLDIYDHKQSTIYYKSGLKDFDNKFKMIGHIKEGYVTTLISYENAVSIVFVRYSRDDVSDFGVAHIDRNNIIRFEEKESSNLTIVKREDAKHKAKYMWKNSAGLLGSLTGMAGEVLISANTELQDGSTYYLYYIDNKGDEKKIELYSSKEFSHDSQLFLNTYFKPILPAEAKTPVSESSNCFIATACYRDLFAPEVINFRLYRDHVLMKNIIGNLLVNIYYIISPHIYKKVYNSPKFTVFIKLVLDRINSRIKTKFESRQSNSSQNTTYIS